MLVSAWPEPLASADQRRKYHLKVTASQNSELPEDIKSQSAGQGKIDS